MIDSDRAVQLLKQQLEKPIETFTFDHPDVERWYSLSERIVEEAFGRKSKNYSQFLFSVSYGLTPEERQESHVSSILSKKAQLRGFIDQLSTFPSTGSQNMHPNESPIAFRRMLLEELSAYLERHASEKSFIACRSLPSGKIWASDLVCRQFEILAQEGRVNVKKLIPTECCVELTPLGRRSLEMVEEEWQRRGTTSVVNTNRIDMSSSTIHNLAQVAGSHGASISQAQQSNDLQGVISAIDRLVEAVKNSSLDSAEKTDAQLEAEILKGELSKNKPNPNRIQQTLEWFKALGEAAKFLPVVIELVDKVKAYLPGVWESLPNG